MQFQVPQFIDVEDKIIGPFSLKQFLYLAMGGAASLIFFLLVSPILALIIVSPIIAFTLALAFYKINGRDFFFFLNSIVNHYMKPRLYTWRKLPRVESEQKQKEDETSKETPPAQHPAPSTPKILPVKQRLKSLSWKLDIMKHEK